MGPYGIDWSQNFNHHVFHIGCRRLGYERQRIRIGSLGYEQQRIRIGSLGSDTSRLSRSWKDHSGWFE